MHREPTLEPATSRDEGTLLTEEQAMHGLVLRLSSDEAYN